MGLKADVYNTQKLSLFDSRSQASLFGIDSAGLIHVSVSGKCFTIASSEDLRFIEPYLIFEDSGLSRSTLTHAATCILHMYSGGIVLLECNALERKTWYQCSTLYGGTIADALTLATNNAGSDLQQGGCRGIDLYLREGVTENSSVPLLGLA